ncbi:hypothetical protein AB0945_26620 [Streptomyces sp. NPDC005474]|uniref:hypothetical protein n=1 Tax=Streptomyces sp. NPDC005474 TaxID=3154878 RepID=UPI00345154CA
MRALSPSLSSSPCLLSLAGLVALPATADEGWSVACLGTGRPYFSAAGTPGTVLQDTPPVRKPTTRRLNVRLTGSSWLTLAVPGIDFTARTATINARASGRTATVRVRLRGGGPRLSALTVEHVTVRGDRIAYELINRGTTGLTPTLAVPADGLLGPLLDRAPRTLPVRLPPGRRLALTERWSKRPAFDAVDVRLTFPAADGTVRDEAGASVRFVPWGGVVGVGGVLSAGGDLLGVRRLRRRTRDEPPCERAELATETDRLTGAMT